MRKHDLTKLVELSRRYGSDARYVLLGGGNTSWKTEEVMYVKASGHMLATIDEEGFVAMSLPRLNAIWEKTYPEDPEAREQAVLADMMGSRCNGETKRPSVEALLHALLPFPYVVHLHPAMVNGITCAQSGEKACQSLFSEALWIPLVNPGYILAKTIRDRLAMEKRPIHMLFLQNHGVFVCADSPKEIDRYYEHIMGTISRHLVRTPVFTEVKVDQNRREIVQKGLERFYGAGKPFPMVSNRELHSRLKDRQAFAPISSAFTPDHIVYSGHAPLWIDETIFASVDPVEQIAAACELFAREQGVAAKIIAVQKTAAFATSEAALLLFLDTLKVAAFTESFGGPRFMDEDQIAFIRDWEVESYRAKMAAE